MLDKTTLLALQKEVREVNELNGWFDRERPFSADIALLHSEVDEFVEAYHGTGDDNPVEELADTLIRLLDTAEREKIDLLLGADDITDIPWNATGLHLLISRAYEGYRNNDRIRIEAELSRLLHLLPFVANQWGHPLEDAVREKLEKNRQRGYRHGGKVE